MDNRKNKPIISKDDITLTSGTDAFLEPDKPRKTLAVKKDKRNAFFAVRPKTKKLLQRFRANPPIEEGRYTDVQHREHEGEFIITTEALRILIDPLIKQHYQGKGYNTNNLVVLNYNDNELGEAIDIWKKSDSQDIKITYLNNNHLIHLYLRKIEGKIHCFVMDSQPARPIEEVLDTIHFHARDVEITRSTTPLQLDFYSCPIFSTQAMKYFVKHGSEVFGFVAKHKRTWNEKLKCYDLDSLELMPELMKMIQSRIELPDAVLDQVVSHKKNLTLRQYLEKYRLNFDGKDYNSRAIIKRYQYLEQLNDAISDMIDSLRYLQRLTMIRDYFNTGNKSTFDITTHNILHFLEGLPNDARNQYDELFPNKQDQNELVRLQQLLFIAGITEGQTHIAKTYLQFANKLIALFDDHTQAIKYLERHLQPKSHLPVHDVCLFDLPEDNAWDKNYWRKMVMQHGMQAARHLANAGKIDNIRTQQLAGKNQNELIGLNELQRLQFYASKLTYTRANEHPELAALCTRFGRTEHTYNQCADIAAKGFKPYELIPDIAITGSELGEKFKGFRFEKLKYNDLRGFFLGEYTGCCQNMGGAGQYCVEHGMTSPLAGFYVIYNQDGDIAVQLYAYLSNDNMLIFDSWEPKSPEYNHLLQPFLTKAGEIAINAGLNGVRLGAGGRTPKENSFKPATTVCEIQPGFCYDAVRQLTVCDKPDFSNEMRQKFKSFCANNQLSYAKFAHLVTDKHSRNITILNMIDELSAYELYQLITFFDIHWLGHASAENKFRHLDTNLISMLIAANRDNRFNDKLNYILQKLQQEHFYDDQTLEDASFSFIRAANPDHNVNGPLTALQLLDGHHYFSTAEQERDFYSLGMLFYDTVLERDEYNFTMNSIFDFGRPMLTMDITVDIDDDGTVHYDANRQLIRGRQAIATYFTMQVLNDLTNNAQTDYLEVCKQVLHPDSMSAIAKLPTFLLKLIHQIILKNDSKFLRYIFQNLNHPYIGIAKSLIDAPDPTNDVLDIHQAPLLFNAIYHGDQAMRNAFVESCCDKDKLQYTMRNYTTLQGRSLIDLLAAIGETEKTVFCRELFPDEESWLGILRTNSEQSYSKSWGSTAHEAARNAHWQTLTALIETFSKPENLHSLMTCKDDAQKTALQYISTDVIQKQPEMINALGAAIRKVYSGESHLLQELTDGLDNQTLRMIINRPEPRNTVGLFPVSAKLKPDNQVKTEGVTTVRHI